MLSRPEFQIRKGLRQQLLDLIRKWAHIVNPVRKAQVANDPEDNIFIECAAAPRGNVRHFPRFWKNTKVLTSREFRSLVASHLVG